MQRLIWSVWSVAAVAAVLAAGGCQQAPPAPEPVPFTGGCEVLSRTVLALNEAPPFGPSAIEVIAQIDGIQRTAELTDTAASIPPWSETLSFRLLPAGEVSLVELARYEELETSGCREGTFAIAPVAVEVDGSHFTAQWFGEGALMWSGADLSQELWFDFHVDIAPDPWLEEIADQALQQIIGCSPGQPNTFHVGSIDPSPEPPWENLSVGVGVTGGNCFVQLGDNDGVWVDPTTDR